jgi:hypothetical protein
LQLLLLLLFFLDRIVSGAYHKSDLERLQADNEWIRAFYKHGYESHDKTVAIINEVLTWRQEFEANSEYIFNLIYTLHILSYLLYTQSKHRLFSRVDFSAGSTSQPVLRLFSRIDFAAGSTTFQPDRLCSRLYDFSARFYKIYYFNDNNLFRILTTWSSILSGY